ncbi:winged helix-turn-helix domain-containing protein [Marinomonas sp. PE14-40]|uniref:winged helix-turn-helix domain-containing protein n=1 Tax=Marinomonas sp. PE14-40 TaxID=3060621 RepID=UPI003F665890
MIEIKSSKDITRLRRLALSAQGLLQAQPFGSGKLGACNAINHLGYVQIDTISVVERAHHHVLHSRVPKFKAEMTNELMVNGDIFEYWSHAAAFLPMSDFRYSLPYKEAIKSGQTHWYKDPDTVYMAELLARVRTDGPLRSRDIETQTKKQAGWWDWKPAKKALEQLYMQGDLMVSSREGFQKTYDLTERVLPDYVNTSFPSLEEFAEHLLSQQLRCHGFVSLKGLTYLRRNTGLRKAMKALLSARLDQGLLEQIQLVDGEIYVIEKRALESKLPRSLKRFQILSPFDNSLIQRERLKSIFGFQYQIECYVPEAKRQYGYFSLPLLYQDEFVGRMDCKAHRKDKHFEIKFLHFEDSFIDKVSKHKKGYEAEFVVSSFAEALQAFSRIQKCDSTSLTKMQPVHLHNDFVKALEMLNGNHEVCK